HVALLDPRSRVRAPAPARALLALATAGRRLGGPPLAALAVVALLLPALLPGNPLHLLRPRWEVAGDDRLSGRLDIWRVGLAMLADRPLQGTGFAGFRDAFYEYMLQTPLDPHFPLLPSPGNRVAPNVSHT